jgi:hypothetical protein
MVAAVEAVEHGKLSLRRAAEEYGIPKSTLQDRVSGKVGMDARSGRRLLSEYEEKKLVEFLIGCASVGYAKSRKEVLILVQHILSQHGKHTEVTKGWWDSFKGRHPEITLRNAEKLAYARASATNPTVIHCYFDLLEETLKDSGLSARPAQIFNCDETGLPLVHQPPKVVAPVGCKHPYTITSSDKSQITVLACASAAGNAIPPMVIFDRKALKPDMTVGEVPGTFYGLSESGWMDSELFEEWFKHHFLRYAPPIRPLILLLDGHSSHYQPNFIRTALAEKVIIFCLPPHSTHILQPLDNGVFGSLKKQWGEACHQYCSKNPGKVVNRYNFSQIFQSAWVRAMSMQNILSSFRTTGVYPTSRDAVLSQFSKGMSEQSSTEENDVPFVPFCTPRRRPLALDTSATDTTEEQPHTPTTTMPLLDCSHPKFSSAEVRKYRVRLEEGYDVPDERYAQWLSTVDSEKGIQCTAQVSSFEKILHIPSPPHKIKSRGSRGGRVLTSEDCQKELYEKELRKVQKEKEKKEKAAERQRKADEKEKRRIELEKNKAAEKQRRIEENERKREEMNAKARERQRKAEEERLRKEEIEKQRKREPEKRQGKEMQNLKKVTQAAKRQTAAGQYAGLLYQTELLTFLSNFTKNFRFYTSCLITHI